jgi:hypothetical protein
MLLVEVVIDTADGRCCHPKFETPKKTKILCLYRQQTKILKKSYYLKLIKKIFMLVSTKPISQTHIHKTKKNVKAQ